MQMVAFFTRSVNTKPDAFLWFKREKVDAVNIQILLTLSLMRVRNLPAVVIVMLLFWARRPSFLDPRDFTISGSWAVLI